MTRSRILAALSLALGLLATAVLLTPSGPASAAVTPSCSVEHGGTGLEPGIRWSTGHSDRTHHVRRNGSWHAGVEGSDFLALPEDHQPGIDRYVVRYRVAGEIFDVPCADPVVVTAPHVVCTSARSLGADFIEYAWQWTSDEALPTQFHVRRNGDWAWDWNSAWAQVPGEYYDRNVGDEGDELVIRYRLDGITYDAVCPVIAKLAQ